MLLTSTRAIPQAQGDALSDYDVILVLREVHSFQADWEWLVELDHEWSVKPGPYGRGLKRRRRLERWAELEGTYAGA